MREINAYPLTWPIALLRTEPSDRQYARFGTKNNQGWGNKKLTVSQALNRLRGELGRYTKVGKDWRVDPDMIVVSTNMRTRLDGLPYSSAREPDDPGVCVYFELDGFPVALPCDTFKRVADNIAAIAGHIEADRRQERYGVGTSAQRFAGFRALPAPGEGSGSAWWDILGIERTANENEVRQAFRRMAKAAHPDAGGTTQGFQVIKVAYEQALRAVMSGQLICSK